MRRYRFMLPLVAGALALAAATAAFARPSHTTSAAKSQAISCSSTMKLALVTPLTGGAGFLGNEQLSWAKYAMKTLPKTLGSRSSSSPATRPSSRALRPRRHSRRST